MQYVQNLPPVASPAPDSGAVKAADHVAAAHRVEARTLPPLIYRRREEDHPMPAIHRRQAPRDYAAGNDRRKLCRRLREEAVLEDLRAGQDRRRHNQRKGDITTAVDEKI